MNNRELAIVASIHIRGAIQGLSGRFANLNTVRYIDQRCYAGELKFKKKDPFRYTELHQVRDISGKVYKRMHKNTIIATDTFIDALYHGNEHEFKNYFKLSNKVIGQLFQMFGDDDDCEAQTIVAAEFLLEEIIKAEEVHKWQQWIRLNQRKYTLKGIRDGLRIQTERDNSNAISVH